MRETKARESAPPGTDPTAHIHGGEILARDAAGDFQHVDVGVALEHGARIAAGGFAIVAVDGAEIRSVAAHSRWIRKLAVSPDQKRIATVAHSEPRE